jgi:hypothetical protein
MMGIVVSLVLYWIVLSKHEIFVVTGFCLGLLLFLLGGEGTKRELIGGQQHHGGTIPIKLQYLPTNHSLVDIPWGCQHHPIREE